MSPCNLYLIPFFGDQSVRMLVGPQRWLLFLVSFLRQSVTMGNAWLLCSHITEVLRASLIPAVQMLMMMARFLEVYTLPPLRKTGLFWLRDDGNRFASCSIPRSSTMSGRLLVSTTL